MPGQIRSRKRKTCSESKGSRKVCSSRRRCVMSLQSSVESRPCIDKVVDHSQISCECELWTHQRKCSASPPPHTPHTSKDKENLQGQDWEKMECEDCSKNMFLDEDSNQILPVEQFFGNMDTLQDFPERRSAPSSGVQREERRRRYYAQDSEEEEEEEEEA